MNDNMIDYELLEELAFDAGGDVRATYSGRNMYGATCAGIVLRNTTDLITLGCSIQALYLGGKLEADIHSELTSGAQLDDMGRSLIVYWPNVSVEE